jgi:hypothetical protein
MIASIGIYFDEDTFASFGVIFLLAIIALYIVPMFLHLKTLKIVDFLKGIVYLIFMTPTYINIMAVYAVSNIHDVSWGSRPVGTISNAISKKEANMSAEYQDFRSRFLIVWIVLNNAVGFLVVVLSRSSQNVFLFLIGSVLFTTVGIKFVFSVLHVLKAMYLDWALSSFLSKSKKKGRNFEIKKYNDPEQHKLLKNFPHFEYQKQAVTKVKVVVDKDDENVQITDETFPSKLSRSYLYASLNNHIIQNQPLIMFEQDLFQKVTKEISEPSYPAPKVDLYNKPISKNGITYEELPIINNLTEFRKPSYYNSEESKKVYQKDLSLSKRSDSIKEETYKYTSDSEEGKQATIKVNKMTLSDNISDTMSNSEIEHSVASQKIEPSNLKVRGFSSDGKF